MAALWVHRLNRPLLRKELLTSMGWVAPAQGHELRGTPAQYRRWLGNGMHMCNVYTVLLTTLACTPASVAKAAQVAAPAPPARDCAELIAAFKAHSKAAAVAAPAPPARNGAELISAFKAHSKAAAVAAPAPPARNGAEQISAFKRHKAAAVAAPAPPARKCAELISAFKRHSKAAAPARTTSRRLRRADLGLQKALLQ